MRKTKEILARKRIYYFLLFSSFFIIFYSLLFFLNLTTAQLDPVETESPAKKNTVTSIARLLILA